MKTIELPCGIIVEIDGDGGGTITSDLADEFGNQIADVLESFILAQACAGIDIASENYKEALLTSLDAIVNNIF